MIYNEKIRRLSAQAALLINGRFDELKEEMPSGAPDETDYFFRTLFLAGQQFIHNGLSRKYFLCLFHETPNLLFVLGEGLKIAEANRRSCVRLGIGEDGLIGKAFGEIIEGGEEGLGVLADEAGKAGRPLLSINTSLLDHKGNQVAVQLKFFRLPEGWGRHQEILVIGRETGLAATREWVRVAMGANKDASVRARMSEAMEALDIRDVSNPAIVELGLSEEDLQVLGFLAQSLTCKDIGEKLGGDHRLGERRKARLLRKFKVETPHQLMIEATRRKLIGPDAYWG